MIIDRISSNRPQISEISGLSYSYTWEEGGINLIKCAIKNQPSSSMELKRGLGENRNGAGCSASLKKP